MHLAYRAATKRIRRCIIGSYTLTGPFTNGAAPGISAAFLNAQENAIKNGGMIYFITPFHLTTNPTVNSGVTTPLTCTGVGGVPAGALAVLIGGGISSGTAGAYITVAPNGLTLGQYGGWTCQNGSSQLEEFVMLAPIASNGKLDVHANGGNIVLQDWYIIAYVI